MPLTVGYFSPKKVHSLECSQSALFGCWGREEELFATINQAQHLQIICGAIKIATKILWCAIMFLPSEHH